MPSFIKFHSGVFRETNLNVFSFFFYPLYVIDDLDLTMLRRVGVAWAENLMYAFFELKGARAKLAALLEPNLANFARLCPRQVPIALY